MDEESIQIWAMKELHEKPLEFRFSLMGGESMLLAYRKRGLAFIRPYDPEIDADLDGPRFKELDNPMILPDEKRVFMTLDDIRKNSEVFMYGLSKGKEFVIGSYKRPLGVARAVRESDFDKKKAKTEIVKR